MTTTTKAAHTPGAMRAAWQMTPELDAREMAEIIDRETGGPELLEALETIVGEIRGTCNKWRLEQFAELGEAAIQKARGGQ